MWEWRSASVAATVVGALVIAGNRAGLFQLLEWATFDEFFRLRPRETIEEKIAIVTIDESDIREVGQWPIPDEVLAELLDKINQQNPRVIGLDIYRDLPVGSGRDRLMDIFNSTHHLIGVEKIIGEQVEPPPSLSELDRVGIADFVLDADGKVRRGLLSSIDDDVVKLGLGVRAALMYLEAEGLTLEVLDAPRQKYQLGKAIFTRLTGEEAGYSGADPGGYQIFINWRGAIESFPTASMTDVLEGRVPPNWASDRIILIGSTAKSTNDFFNTPYSSTILSTGKPTAGVVIHANLASQILRGALEGRPMLRAWPSPSFEWAWILAWSMAGAIGSWALEKTSGGKTFWIVFITGGSLVGICYLAFLEGWVVPLLPPLVALVASAIVATNLYKQWRLEAANKQLEAANQKLETANAQLRGYSKTLEAKVEERTRELKQAKIAADSANQAKSEFLANMSHELRTPLNGILGYAQILQRDKEVKPKQKDGIDIIHQCGTHLLTLINDVLDLSKVEARKLELYPKDFNFFSFLTGVAEICRIKAEQKGIAWKSVTGADLPGGIHADEKRLRQVLINLLGNAIKFTDSGGVTFSIRSIRDGDSADRNGRNNSNKEQNVKIRFQIEDTGVGMTPAQLEKIFLPFEQVGDNSRKAEGTGLGLAISHKIVSLMGSQMEVQSRVGEGTAFWFDLEMPVAKDWMHSCTGAKSGNVIGIQGKKPTLLMVDDREQNRSVVVTVLKSIGFSTLEATNGKEGLELADKYRPNLMITDLSMPVMDGFEMMGRLRADPELKKIPIIVSSASVFETDRRQSLAAGGDEFLPKPVQIDNLLEVLQRHLKLEWIYEESRLEPEKAIAPEKTASDEMVPPDKEELETLYHLALMGHLQGIEEAIEELQAKDAKLVPFATQVRQFSDSFEVKKIQEFIRSFQEVGHPA